MAENEKQPLLIALGILGLIVLVYLVYTFYQDNQAQNQVPQTVEVPIVVQEPIVEPEPEPVIEAVPEPAIVVEPEPSFVLPKLDESDQLIRDAVVTLSGNAGISGWLIPDELIRKFVVLVDNTSHGSVPRKHVGFLAPEGPFLAAKVSDSRYVLNEESYERYNLLAEIFSSIDSRRAVEFYVLTKPMFQEAYRELGYTDKSFDAAIFSAIGRILETPVITKPIELVRPVVMYKYVDPRLESLSETQKQIVRMGPNNTRIIQAKLSEIAIELRNVLED
jgi:hypothetical protein